jgi:hypothetical protein
VKGGGTMKIKVAFFLFWITGFLMQSISWATEVKTYRNDKAGFEITYLDNWVQATAPGKPVFFIKRKSTAEAGNISIDVRNLTGNKERFIQELRSDINKNRFIAKIRTRFPEAEVLEHGDTYLGGFPAYFISISYKIKNLGIEVEVVSFQVFCVRGTKVYLVNFETSVLFFEKVFNEFLAIIATFNFR